MKYSDDATVNKACKQFIANQRRQAKYVPAPGAFYCADGPWEGQELFLQLDQPRTMYMVISGQRGRYVFENGKLRWKTTR